MQLNFSSRSKLLLLRNWFSKPMQRLFPPWFAGKAKVLYFGTCVWPSRAPALFAAIHRTRETKYRWCFEQSRTKLRVTVEARFGNNRQYGKFSPSLWSPIIALPKRTFWAIPRVSEIRKRIWPLNCDSGMTPRNVYPPPVFLQIASERNDAKVFVSFVI